MNDTSRIDIIETEAAAWFAKHRGSRTSEQDEAFQQWLATSAEHVSAYERCMAAWLMTDALSQDLDIMNIRQSVQASLTTNTAEHTVKYGFLKHLYTPRAIAAVSLLFLCLFIAKIALYPSAITYTTKVGEQRLIKLDDGSQVTLNTNSELKVKYSSDMRELTLVKGEVYFDVAKDRQRPFVVSIDESKVTAVGTAFNISFDPFVNSVAVDVTEGVVELTPSIDSVSLPATQLKVGEAASILDSGNTVKPKAVEFERINAWRERKIYFKNTSLSEAVADYNRYLDYEIEIRDDTLKQEKVTGIFHAGDTSSFLFTLKLALQVKTRHEDGKLILYKETI
ncbi:FecR family protein [Teredinibacter sp. KSP-S5-2]|uniref:FecR family protein n=1 Tax=Teredinibacter sp. KSP-S5-2 TaxID=3034506 RepID=UPI002934CA50|nr:FecR family protein [Teredinibacter sp. KSP-S5-2]WNO07618.1 FecR family protein [Teredinibacter sp. KSP-S5-2]